MHSTSKTPRDGRALVECIVAIFLLSISALSMAMTVRGTLALADDAALVSHAQSLATTRVEDGLTTPCANGASGFDQVPRIGALWVQNGSARNTQLHLDLTLDRSPIAFPAAHPCCSALKRGGSVRESNFES